MQVKVIQRQTADTPYTYSLPGHTDKSTQTHVKCKDDPKNVNCTQTTTTETEYQAPQQGSYSVTGATLSLALPDGRVAVANCVSKTNFFGPSAQTEHERSCRVPPVDDIQAEFKGKNVKLAWPVSVDGSKLESETYKILAILDKQ